MNSVPRLRFLRFGTSSTVVQFIHSKHKLKGFLRCFSSLGSPGPGGQSYACCPSSLSYLTQTVDEVITQGADLTPNRLAVISCHQNLRKTYKEFDKDVEALAAGFLALGLKKGDRLGVWGPNNYEWILAQFATSRAGLILVTINPAYQATELEFCLKMVQCKAIVTAESYKTQDYLKLIASVSPDLQEAQDKNLKLSRLPDLTTIILTGESRRPGIWNFSDVLSAGKSEHLQALKEVCPQFDDAVNIQYTSGTTGQPKAATLSNFNLINNAFFTGRRFGYHEKPPVVCMQVPLYHCFGCVLGTLSVFLYQGTCVLPAPSFQARPTMKAIHDERCTFVYGTPTMYVDMIGLPDFQKFDCSNLKGGVMSGASCAVELIKNVKAKLGMQHVLIPYGCTETSPVCTVTCADDPVEKQLTTVGRPLDTVEVKVVSESGKVTPVGTPGEVCLRGFTTFLGYWGQEDKTKEILKPDKWYYTGDIGHMDEQGYLYIVGRIKDMIIRGGENIYPREIEEFLMGHPEIADIHVCGIPDERMGEEVCAWVALNHGSELDEEAIKQYCKGKISHFKIPKHVIFTKDFPKTVTGKVQKFRMRELSVEMIKQNVQREE